MAPILEQVTRGPPPVRCNTGVLPVSRSSARWAIETTDGRSVLVRAERWLVALGLGLEVLGEYTDLTRLACDVLPGGKVVARDVCTGRIWIITMRQHRI